MKQPTAPPIYPELPIEDGQNYRLQKISEIERKLIIERDARKALYKKYKRGMNATDGVDTVLISTSVVMAGVGLAVPALLPLEIAAILCGCAGVCVKLVRRKLASKVQKHYEIKTLGESKLNSIKNLISKALNDGQISQEEFKTVLDDLDRYTELKDKLHTKNSGLSEQEKKEVNRRRKITGTERHQNGLSVRCVWRYFSFFCFCFILHPARKPTGGGIGYGPEFLYIYSAKKA